MAPGTDLANVLEKAPEGTTFLLEQGVHRGFQIEPKDGMSFIGEPGTILSGAIVIDGFVATEAGWSVSGVQPTVRDHGRCLEGYTGCSFSQDLFMDDVMLWQVTEMDDLEPGSWFWEGETIYVFDDPTTRRVELSTTPYAFIGSASDVTIAGVTIVKYATPAQAGTIQSQEPAEGGNGTRWTIEDVDLSGSHGVGIRTGDGTVIRNSYIHHNGQLGITAAGSSDILIENNEIAYNNLAGFTWEWEAGGVKITNSTGVVLRGNFVHDNVGPGLWADLDTLDTTYEGNTVLDNTGPGIFHEISGAAIVRDNVVERNGSDKASWLWGAGILIAASSDVEVYGNVVNDNENGITGIQQDRGDGPYGPRLLTNLYVHDNTLTLGGGHVGIVEDVGDDAVFTDGANRFEANTYIDVDGRNYRWDDRRLDRNGWMEAGQDVDGTWR